jgi:hypothetical protein
VLVTCIAAALCVTAGAFTRPATFVTWLAFDRLTRLNPSYSSSPDRLLVNLLFILLFSGCGRALSVDARWRNKSGDAPAWPRYLLVGQLVVVSFASAVQKFPRAGSRAVTPTRCGTSRSSRRGSAGRCFGSRRSNLCSSALRQGHLAVPGHASALGPVGGSRPPHAALRRSVERLSALGRGLRTGATGRRHGLNEAS